MKGAEIFLNVLKDIGVTTVYGIVGREAEVILFNEVTGIDFMLTRDERSAAFMADIQGRITGKVGVCYSTFGPGSTNLITGVASAYADRSPVLVVSAQVEQEAIHPSTHQCVDQVAVMQPVVKYAKEITDISELERELIRAISIAEQGLPGPCFISIPLDIFSRTATDTRPPFPGNIRNVADLEDRRIGRPPIAPSSLDDLKVFLLSSRCPVVIVGGNIFNESDRSALAEILNILNIPVFTTYGGKRNVSCAHKNYVGTVSKYLNYFSLQGLERLFKDADSIILVGVDAAEGMGPSVWSHGKNKKIGVINSILQSRFDAVTPDLLCEYSYHETLEYIRNNIDSGFFRKSYIDDLKEAITRMKQGISLSGAGSIDAMTVVRVMQRVLSAGDVVVTDVGIHKQMMSLFYETQGLNEYFCSNGLGSMGFGVPAAIGAKKTLSPKRVVAVCGDAGFHLSSHELETSVRYHLPIICLVFHDASVGLIRHYQKKGFKTGNSRITDFGRTDYVALAASYGCRGYRVATAEQLESVLKRNLDSDVSVVIEIPLDKQQYVFPHEEA